MKKVAKTLLFVPVMALTSCGGAAKIDAAKALERSDEIMEVQAAEDWDVPQQFSLSTLTYENQGYTLDGKVEEAISQKLTVDAKVNLDENKLYMRQALEVVETTEGVKGEVEKQSMESWIFIDEENNLVMLDDEDGEKTKAVMECEDKEEAEGYFALIMVLSMSSDLSTVMYYDGVAETLDYFTNGFGVPLENIKETYKSSGAGSLETTFTGSLESDELVPDTTVQLKDTMTYVIKNNYVVDFRDVYEINYLYEDEGVAVVEFDQCEDRVQAKVGKTSVSLPKNISEFVEAAE